MFKSLEPTLCNSCLFTESIFGLFLVFMFSFFTFFCCSITFYGCYLFWNWAKNVNNRFAELCENTNFIAKQMATPIKYNVDSPQNVSSPQSMEKNDRKMFWKSVIFMVAPIIVDGLLKIFRLYCPSSVATKLNPPAMTRKVGPIENKEKRTDDDMGIQQVMDIFEQLNKQVPKSEELPKNDIETKPEVETKPHQKENDPEDTGKCESENGSWGNID